MTAADAEVFRRSHEAWTDDDLEAALDCVDPEVVAWPLHGVLFTQAEYRGREGIVQWYAEMKRPWDRFDVTVERVWETREGEVGILHFVGRRGDEAFDARVASVCRLRDGRIVTLRRARPRRSGRSSSRSPAAFTIHPPRHPASR